MSSAGGWPQRYGRDSADPVRQLWERCVFIDWHGVLCDDVFWQSITRSPAHQKRRWLGATVTKLFREQAELTARWMRGQVDTRFVLSTFDPFEDRRCGEDFLHRRLLHDCTRMQPHDELLAALATLPDLTLVVLATDNMDCFSDSLPAIRPLHGRIDVVLCSSDLGVLKAESPDRFFGSLLEEHGLLPEQAVLIDDSHRNCDRFERFGGTAIHFNGMRDALERLDAWVQESATEHLRRPSRAPRTMTSARRAGSRSGSA